MESLLLFTGIIVGIFGLLLVLAPKELIKLSEVLNRSLSSDKRVFNGRRIFGLIFILAGIYLFYVSSQYGLFK